MEVLAGDLRFSKLNLEDSGMYQCVAENKHGTIYASAELAVQGKGPRRQGQPWCLKVVSGWASPNAHLQARVLTYTYMFFLVYQWPLSSTSFKT